MAASWLSPPDILACWWVFCSAPLRRLPWDETEVEHSQPRPLSELGLAAVLIPAPYRAGAKLHGHNTENCRLPGMKRRAYICDMGRPISHLLGAFGMLLSMGLSLCSTRRGQTDS